ncbi:MAG TPA: glycosyltransferase family 2 protein [Chitinophagaceae bacterium]|nr:glycosyltransferase family 2 protein [Chitinophagaceae bacterium]
MPIPTCSLIVSTYNRPDALRVSVESIFRQVELPNEIIIADDGSGQETRDLIEQLKKESPVPMVHVWQEDEGYQLARIRNRAFAAAKYDYIIQIDGDLVLDKYFVQDHLKIAKPSTFFSGSRTMIDETLTQEVLQKSLPAQDIPNQKEHLSKRTNALRSPLLTKLAYLYQRHDRNYKYVIGCNMAFWKKDLNIVNGYDESFKGWGKEDNDLAVRLQNAGIKLRFIKFGAITYHLHHKVADLSAVPSNEEKLHESIREKRTFVPDGLSKYS